MTSRDLSDPALLTLKGIRSWLARSASEAERAKLARYGIPDARALGVPMGSMLGLARDQPKDPALAAALWAEGGYDSRTLAVLIDDPAALTPERMDAMVADFDNWAICDTAGFRLFDRAPGAWEAVPRWVASDRPYTRRAGFALVWGLSVHDKAADTERFIDALALAEAFAGDDRPLSGRRSRWPCAPPASRMRPSASPHCIGPIELNRAAAFRRGSLGECAAISPD